jgi:hypothetical protein
MDAIERHELMLLRMGGKYRKPDWRWLIKNDYTFLFFLIWLSYFLLFASKIPMPYLREKLYGF